MSGMSAENGANSVGCPTRTSNGVPIAKTIIGVGLVCLFVTAIGIACLLQSKEDKKEGNEKEGAKKSVIGSVLVGVGV